MTSADLSGLPLPPPGRQGWPWQAESQPVPVKMSDGRPWPKITVITPNFNYGHYLEETIRSVVLQNYPNLEYIVMDGGSSDGSVEIIERYGPWIDCWESEKDRGQAHAINKGFACATGDLIAWINSDDLLLPDALFRIAEAYAGHGEKLIFGNVIDFYPDGREERVVQAGIALENFIGIPQEGLFRWHQPGIVIPRAYYEAVGGLDESLHYIFDWDWFSRLLIHHPDIIYLDAFVAKFRVHEEAKTGLSYMACWQEIVNVVERYAPHLKGVSVGQVKAFYHLKIASLYFCEHPGSAHHWSRIDGIRSLLKALWEDGRLMMDGRFIRLLIRALLPRRFYRSGLGGGGSG